MPFPKPKISGHKTKELEKTISSGYDSRSPSPAYTGGYGCGICDPPPAYCDPITIPCGCKEPCMTNNNYLPKKTYKTIKSLQEHLWTHGLLLSSDYSKHIEQVMNRTFKC